MRTAASDVAWVSRAERFFRVGRNTEPGTVKPLAQFMST